MIANWWDLQAETMAGFKGKWKLAYWVFQMHMAVNGWLHARFPTRFSHPGLVPMMTIQTLPYSRVLARIRTPFYSLACGLVLAVGLLIAHVGFLGA